MVIAFRVRHGNRAPRPESAPGLPDRVWNMITACWDEKRDFRWDIRAVCQELSASSTQKAAEGERGNRIDLYTLMRPFPSRDFIDSAKSEYRRGPLLRLHLASSSRNDVHFCGR